MFRSALLLCIQAAMLLSCTSQHDNKPDATGRTSEILVVCEQKDWQSIVGRTIKTVLTRQLPGLPAPESEFSLINVPDKGFGEILQKHRNVLIVRIHPSISTPHITTFINHRSSPQRVIEVEASSDTAFVRSFNSRANSILELFRQNERIRFIVQNKLNRDPKLEKMIADSFGLKLIVPRDYYLAAQKPGFAWLRFETSTMSMGIMIYKNTGLHKLQPAWPAICDRRDSITRLHIQGPRAGSFMVVSRQPVEPLVKTVKLNGRSAFETRGLWKTAGDFMGGPFVNYCFTDPSGINKLTIDGYLYYPNNEKRNYIRQLEAIAWSAEFNPSEPNK